MTGPPRVHFILLGGFLGAGKTSAISRLAHYIMDQGLRVGAITNDQGRHLVDTQTLRARGISAAEVAGGCFCCQFDALLEGCRQLASESPDVYVAEAVGSCVDLAATVAAPLQRLERERFTVAPLSVVVDPIQARRCLGLEAGDAFSPAVRYLYLKQMEEADLIVINKTEIISALENIELRGALAERFPRAELFSVSVRDNANLESWFDRVLLGECRDRPIMPLDYDLYADGEARLAWFNGAASVSGSEPFDPDRVLMQLALEVQQYLRERPAKIAHLKISLESDDSTGGGLTLVNLVPENLRPEFGQRHGRTIGRGRLTINLRAETDPEWMAAAVWRAVAKLEPLAAGWHAQPEFEECFSPARPAPTHPRRNST